MTFPVETEANIRRRILDICREQTMNVVDITRELALMTDNVSDGKTKEFWETSKEPRRNS